MRQTPLKRSTPLRQGTKGLTTRRPLERRSHLRDVSERRLAAVPNQPRSTFRRHGGFTPASAEQRAKVRKQGCRVTATHEFDDDAGIATVLPITPGSMAVDPAHITDRALGGCDDEACVVGLRRDLHRLYDMGQFDLLPYLTPEEQAHAVTHSGILGALQQITGCDWAPVEDDGPTGVAA